MCASNLKLLRWQIRTMLLWVTTPQVLYVGISVVHWSASTWLHGITTQKTFVTACCIHLQQSFTYQDSFHHLNSSAIMFPKIFSHSFQALLLPQTTLVIQILQSSQPSSVDVNQDNLSRWSRIKQDLITQQACQSLVHGLENVWLASRYFKIPVV